MPKICIDPGHGGTSPGAAANGLVEKNLNLEVSLLLRDLLLKDGIDVVMTRTADVTVSLAARTDLANRQACDFFISVHHNGAEATSARGIEVFHQVKSDKAKDLGRAVLRNMVDSLGLPSRGLKTRINSTGGDWYHVLRESKMPAIITEGGFLTSPQDAEVIKTKRYGSRSFLQQEAHAIHQGVLDFLGRERAARPFPDVPADHWAADAVRELKDAGIFIGLSDGTFSGGDKVSRYELAVTLRRLLTFLRR